MSGASDPAPAILHASAVSFRGRAALIMGASGAGKSGLALQLLARGAGLIADDRVQICRAGGEILASCPTAAIRGLIEVRGLGFLELPAALAAPVAMVVDLDEEESARLPPDREISLLGCRLPLVLRPRNDHLADAIFLWLGGGRRISSDE